MTATFTQPLPAGLVSDLQLEVAPYDGNASDTDTIPTTGFVVVRGLQEISPPSVEKNQEDDSDLDSGSWGSQIGTGLEYSMEGTAKRPRPGTEEPGQEILKAAGRSAGVGGFVWWRLTSKVDGSGDMGLADVQFTEEGGERTALTLASFTLTGRGALVPVEPTNGNGNGGDGEEGENGTLSVPDDSFPDED